MEFDYTEFEDPTIPYPRVQLSVFAGMEFERPTLKDTLIDLKTSLDNLIIAIGGFTEDKVIEDKVVEEKVIEDKLDEITGESFTPYTFIIALVLIVILVYWVKSRSFTRHNGLDTM